MARTSIKLNSTKLKDYRLGLGCSQAQLCRRFEEKNIRISIASIKRIESGAAVSFRVAREVADFYGVLLGSILADDEIPLVHLKRENNHFQTCLVCVNFNDKRIKSNYLIDELRKINSNIISHSNSNILFRCDRTDLHNVIYLISQLIRLKQGKSNFDDISYSIIAIKESISQDNAILTVNDRDLCELSFMRYKIINKQILVDKELYHYVFRYFDIEAFSSPSVIDKEYFSVCLYDNQAYVADTRYFKRCQEIVQDNISSTKQKTFISVTGSSGMGKSHWIRYFASLYSLKIDVSSVCMVIPSPENESSLIPRTALFLCTCLHLNLNSTIDDIQRRIAEYSVDFDGISNYNAAARISELLVNQEKTNKSCFYQDVAIIKAIIDNSKAKIFIFDGTFSMYAYYTKVFALAFNKSKYLKCIITSSISDIKNAFDLKDITTVHFPVPKLCHDDLKILVRSWSNNTIPSLKINEIIFNSNENLHILRQIVLESIDDTKLSSKVIEFATVKLDELPAIAYDLLGLLIVALEANFEIMWDRIIDLNEKATWMLCERGILFKNDNDSYSISHESYLQAFKKSTSNEIMISYVEQTMAIIHNSKKFDPLYILRSENYLYSIIGEDERLIDNIKHMYFLPTNATIFDNSIYDIQNGLKVSCNHDSFTHHSILSSVQMSCTTAAFGIDSPITKAIQQKHSRLVSYINEEADAACIFINLIPLLSSLELNSFERIFKLADINRLSSNQKIMLNAIGSCGFLLKGEVIESERLARAVYKQRKSNHFINDRVLEDSRTINLTIILLCKIAQKNLEASKVQYDTIDLMIPTIALPINRCILIVAQLYYLLEIDAVDMIYEKSMTLYDISSKDNINSFKSIAMAFIEWERSINSSNSSNSSNIKKFVGCYNKIIVHHHFNFFYPVFVSMLRKLNVHSNYKHSEITIHHLIRVIDYCTSRGCNLYLHNLYLSLEDEYKHNNIKTLSDDKLLIS